LYTAGLKYVTNIDVCPEAIAGQAKRHAALGEMQYSQIDALRTKIPPSSFGLVVDKALLDTLVAGPDASARALQYLQEMQRVLCAGGWMVVISHGVPSKRVPLLSKCFGLAPGSVRVQTIPKPHVLGIELGAGPDFFVYSLCKA
jgi:ubiquinone/menaquinone biosynthesis C-methylase UbiE